MAKKTHKRYKGVTFVATVKNEEKVIADFIQSLLKQSHKPDEVIIVDGGSNDGTMAQLRRFAPNFQKLSIPYVLVKKKVNRSIGRNIAIQKAHNPIIAVSDAGCILDKNWLKELMHPFNTDKDVDVVSGYYSADYNNPTNFQKALAAYMCVMPDRVNPDDFLPSSRSIAFTKEAWSTVKGYPEYLNTCEDLMFARTLKEAGLSFVFAGKAQVFWPQKKTWLAAAKQFFSYARGDGQAAYVRKQTPLLFGRYILGVLVFITMPQIFVLLVGLYILWSIQKNYRYVRNVHALYLLPIMQFTADIAVVSGMLLGYYERSKKHL